MEQQEVRRIDAWDPVTLRVLLVCLTTAFAVVWISLLIGVMVDAWSLDDVRALFLMLVGLLAGWIAPGPASLGLLPRPRNGGTFPSSGK